MSSRVACVARPVLVICAVIGVGGWDSGATVRGGHGQYQVGTEQATAELERLKRHWIQELTGCGWGQNAAALVVEFNLPEFLALYEADPKLVERRLALLRRLAKHKHAQMFLERHPEFAGLLCGVLEVAPDGPRKIMKSMRQFQRDEAAWNFLASLYQMRLEPREQYELATLLDRFNYRRTALRLLQAGISLPLDVAPRNEDARDVYLDWVADVLDRAERALDWKAAWTRAHILLTFHAPKVAQLLDADVLFRRRFQGDYWPWFRRLLDKALGEDIERKDPNFRTWFAYARDALVWELIHRDGQRGRAVFERAGATATFLLFDDAYKDDPKLREIVYLAFGVAPDGTLIQSDALAVQALIDFADQSHRAMFLDLLRRYDRDGPIDFQVLRRAFAKLYEAGTNAVDKLRLWQTLGDRALKEELGPPPGGIRTWIPGYYIYYVAKKGWQGRPIDAWDWFFAALDAADVLVVVAPPATIPRKVAKQVAQEAAQDFVKEAGERVAGELLENAAERRLAELLAGKVRNVCDRVVEQADRSLLKHPAWIFRVPVGPPLAESQAIDLTRLVGRAFTSGPWGRNSLRRLEGLHARILMRGDRRVLIGLPDSAAVRKRVAAFLTVTAENAIADKVFELQPVQEAIRSVMELLSKLDKKLDKVARQRLCARRNLSASFWATATREWDRMRAAREDAR